MDKEKILSQNKKENLYLDEYEKHIKLQGMASLNLSLHNQEKTWEIAPQFYYNKFN